MAGLSLKKLNKKMGADAAASAPYTSGQNLGADAAATTPTTPKPKIGTGLGAAFGTQSTDAAATPTVTPATNTTSTAQPTTATAPPTAASTAAASTTATTGLNAADTATETTSTESAALPTTTATSGSSAALPYEDVPEAASVADTFNQVTGQDSVLMRQAQTAGLQQANRRGLLNSSMAVGAAQNEAYKTGLSIASQQATIDAEARQNALARNQQTYFKDAELKETARQNAATFLTNMEQIYANQYAAILGNEKIKGSDRTKLIQSAQALRANQRSFVEQIYDIDLTY